MLLLDFLLLFLMIWRKAHYGSVRYAVFRFLLFDIFIDARDATPRKIYY